MFHLFTKKTDRTEALRRLDAFTAKTQESQRRRKAVAALPQARYSFTNRPSTFSR